MGGRFKKRNHESESVLEVTDVSWSAGLAVDARPLKTRARLLLFTSLTKALSVFTAFMSHQGELFCTVSCGHFCHRQRWCLDPLYRFRLGELISCAFGQV